MPLSKRTEEEFNAFLEKEYIPELRGIVNFFPILRFIHQSQVDAVKEFVEVIVPKKTIKAPNALDEDYEKWASGYNACISEIQERIEESLKLL